MPTEQKSRLGPALLNKGHEDTVFFTGVYLLVGWHSAWTFTFFIVLAKNVKGLLDLLQKMTRIMG